MKGEEQTRLFEIPAWLPEEPWREFLRMRAKKRNSPTDYAKRLLISKLDSIRRAGHDPRTIIDNSIEHGWLTFYEPKENGNGRSNTDERNDRLLGILQQAEGKLAP